MATQVRDTKAGQAISAWVVLNKKNEQVATINAHYSDAGRVTVDVWNYGDKPVKRCAEAATKAGWLKLEHIQKAAEASKKTRDWGAHVDHASYALHDLFGMQQGSAGGYGYDKFAAALSRIWIDGHQMADHCGTSPATERLLKQYLAFAANPQFDVDADRRKWEAKAAKLGAHFANWQNGAYRSLYLETGLKRLETLGYRVIQAI